MLLKNRKLEVKLVKDIEPDAATILKEGSSQEMADMANVLAKRLIVGIAVGITVKYAMIAATKIALKKL